MLFSEVISESWLKQFLTATLKFHHKEKLNHNPGTLYIMFWRQNTFLLKLMQMPTPLLTAIDSRTAACSPLFINVYTLKIYDRGLLTSIVVFWKLTNLDVSFRQLNLFPSSMTTGMRMVVSKGWLDLGVQWPSIFLRRTEWRRGT